MAVSKTRTADEIRQAAALGLSLFGENRVEEVSQKFPGLGDVPHSLFLIGHLQSRKVNRIDKLYSGVHSVDSVQLARKLSRLRTDINAVLEVLIQVNTSGEESKSGVRDKTALIDMAAEIARLPCLNLRGLMTMAPFVDDEDVVRNCFSLCRQWSESLESFIEGPPVLSMGMSSDYHWAIKEGTTLLRIGTTLFGRVQ